MKIVTASNGKKHVKMSKSEWTEIGKKTGWTKVSQNEPHTPSGSGINMNYRLSFMAKRLADIVVALSSSKCKSEHVGMIEQLKSFNEELLDLSDIFRDRQKIDYTEPVGYARIGEEQE
jgi:hypothetical protein